MGAARAIRCTKARDRGRTAGHACKQCCPCTFKTPCTIIIPDFRYRGSICQRVDMPVLAALRAHMAADPRAQPAGTPGAAHIQVPTRNKPNAPQTPDYQS